MKALLAIIITSLFACDFSPRSQVLIDDGKNFLEVLWLPFQDCLWEEVSTSDKNFNQFKKNILEVTSINYFELIRAQASPYPPHHPNRKNLMMVLAGRVGKVRKLSELESRLFRRHLKRSRNRQTTLFQTPTEFMSYVLYQKNQLKVYYFTVDQPGIGNISILDPYVSRDINLGWGLMYNLHNHNFFPKEEIIMGAPVPSLQDVTVYRALQEKFNLGQAIVTNGFQSINIEGPEFGILKASH